MYFLHSLKEWVLGRNMACVHIASLAMLQPSVPNALDLRASKHKKSEEGLPARGRDEKGSVLGV